MTGIVTSRVGNADRGIMLLRLILGIVYIYHGGQKLFTIGIGPMTAAFTKLGVPLPGIAAPGIATLEFIGGIALIVGLLTPVFAALLACDMIGAGIFVHFRNGFSLPKGYEFVLTLCCALIALALIGPGAISLDAMRDRARGR